MTTAPLAETQKFETPYLVLDHAKMSANITQMQRRCAQLDVKLRPHLKTPKSMAVAQELMRADVTGFTVSTLREAEYLHERGVKDIFYAVPIVASKIARAARLIREGCDLSVLIDSAAAAAQIANAAQSEGVRLKVWVEIDVDHYRTGVDPAGAEFLDIVRLIKESVSTELVGLMSYGGASYNCKTVDAVADLTEIHRLALIDAAARVESATGSRPLLSFGSTPAVLHARSLAGVDEVRCGIYIFQDLFQAGIGACRVSDVAVSVMASVIGHSTLSNRFVIDAGGLALSKDRSTQGHPFDAGFGLVCDAVSGEPIGDLQVSAVSQELGLVTSPSGAKINFNAFAIGERVRILPNHADMTAAAYDTYVVVADNKVEAVWSRTNGW